MVTAKPGSRRPAVTRLGAVDEAAHLVVRVTARARDGAANEAIRVAVASALGVRQSLVRLHRGTRSRLKQFSVHADEFALRAALAAVPAEPGPGRPTG